MATTDRFENCCFDYTLIGTWSECDRLSCKGEHDPVLKLYHHKDNKKICYCLNRNQLGQFWQCVVNDRITFCPDHCENCNVCKVMHEVFVELQDAYFFYPTTQKANKEESIPYQPVLWCVFTNVIDKNRKTIYIPIAKSIFSNDLVLNSGMTC